jgi:hypothetical protein
VAHAAGLNFSLNRTDGNLNYIQSSAEHHSLLSFHLHTPSLHTPFKQGSEAILQSNKVKDIQCFYKAVLCTLLP